jgi:signal peptidase I
MDTARVTRVETRPFVASAVRCRAPVGREPQLRRVFRDVDHHGLRDVRRPCHQAPAPWRVAVHALATVAAVLAIGLVCVAAAPAIAGYRPVVVVSGSMEPSVRTADVVLTLPSDGYGLDVGTVIRHHAADRSVLHRIVDTTADGYVTKGDANLHADSTPVRHDDVDGVGFLLVPFVGLPNTWVQTGQWIRLLLLAVVLATVFYLARPSWLTKGGPR